MLNSVEYLGHCIDSEGLHATQDKLEAILKAPMPQNVLQLESLLGLINYYAKFISNLSSMVQPLIRLLGGNVKWEWSEECRVAVE